MIVRIPKLRKPSSNPQRQICITHRFRDSSYRQTVITLQYTGQGQKHLSNPARNSTASRQSPTQPKHNKSPKSSMSHSKRHQLLNASLDEVQKILNPHTLQQAQLKYQHLIDKNLHRPVRYGTTLSSYSPEFWTKSGRTLEPREDRREQEVFPRLNKSEVVREEGSRGKKQKVFLGPEPRMTFRNQRVFDIHAVSSSEWRLM